MNMLTEAIINFAKKPFTRKYPQAKPEIPKDFRGKHVYNKEKCIYCGMCARVCPSGAIKVDREKKEWTIDLGKCLFCGQCAESCPVKCLELGYEFELADTDKKNFVIKS